ncbi:aspartate carbamoyltransferase [Candidatus Bathyarchaeota archaeon]|nr:MAG: aspartate carbamoyltransferase [Candidatus Bathyarchaeota archaeon]
MNRLLGKDIISVLDLDRDTIEEIFDFTDRVKQVYEKRGALDILRGKLMASLFFIPSTRTRLSFEAAIRRLGGGVIGFATASVSRAGDYYKETLEDTIRMVDQYADVIVIRHPEPGAAARAAEVADAPVINAGDGNNEHPTQALLDLYTIYQEFGTLRDLHICMVGDQTARTMRSFAYAISNFPIRRLTIVAPPQQRLPETTRKVLEERLVPFEEKESIHSDIEDFDVIYVESIKNAPGVTGVVLDRDYVTPPNYRVDANLMRKAKSSCIVLHSLPRTDELAVELDRTRYARYFKQAYYGMLIRMALLIMVLGKEEELGGEL